jgi:hypothetical protein
LILCYYPIEWIFDYPLVMFLRQIYH